MLVVAKHPIKCSQLSKGWPVLCNFFCVAEKDLTAILRTQLNNSNLCNLPKAKNKNWAIASYLTFLTFHLTPGL